MKAEDNKLTTESMQGFVEEIRQIISEARTRAVRSVDLCRVQMYWTIGKRIFEKEQKGKERADYGKFLIKNLAKEMDAPLLAQIPLVQSICESGDAGKPAACDINTITGQAFISLAQAVVTVTNKRNREQAATKIVEVKKQ